MEMSSERLVKEERLKADYEDEIAMRKEDAAILEEERIRKGKEQKNAMWTNRISTFIAILSLPISILLGWYYFTVINRPYLVIGDTVNTDSITSSSTWEQISSEKPKGAKLDLLVDQHSNSGATSTVAFLIFPIKNIGKVPLKYKVELLTYLSFGQTIKVLRDDDIKGIVGIILPDTDGILLPDQEEVLRITDFNSQVLQDAKDFARSGLNIQIIIQYEPFGHEGWLMKKGYSTQLEGVLSCDEPTKICKTSKWRILNCD